MQSLTNNILQYIIIDLLIVLMVNIIYQLSTLGSLSNLEISFFFFFYFKGQKPGCQNINNLNIKQFIGLVDMLFTKGNTL